MRDPIEQYILSDWNRLIIQYDDDVDSPREWDNIWKLCIKTHKKFNFPNELKRDFDLAIDEEGFDEQQQKLDNYYFFALDCYEHSWIIFSLSWEGTQCQFDTAKDCGFIAIPKISEEVGEITQAQALSYAEWEIKQFNAYLNWESYRYTIESPVVWKAQDNTERYKTEYDIVDWCWGYYDVKDILNEFEKLSPKMIKE